MGGACASVQKASDKIFSTSESVLRITLPKVNATLDNANGLINGFKEIPGNLTQTAEELGNITKMGIGIAAFKCFSDFCNSWYQTVKLTGIANDARNDLKKLANNTSKTEDEIVNVLKNTSGDLKSSVDQFTEDAHKMSQNFGDMTELLSQSSTEISGAVNQANRNFGYMTHITSDFLAYLSQDIRQTSRCFRVTCFSLTTSALAAVMTYLQNSSCDRDPESMLCTAPLKSMVATTITAGFLAMTMLMPNRVQIHQNNEVLASNETTSVSDHSDQILKEYLDLNFFIPEKDIDQNIEWTQEELDVIKAKNFDVFIFIKIKKQLGSKCNKEELKWLLSQDKNIFLKVVL